MFNGTEAEERQYLKVINTKLHQALAEMDDKISASYRDVIEAKKYIWENMTQLDPAERAANRVDVSLTIDVGEKAVAKRRRIQKLMQSPYFGRVDFIGDDETEEQAFYIGVHAFADEHGPENLIYDWRSPISSMFYDFNAGRAFYTAPMGQVDGEIRLKRQYKITDGTMEYMLESSMNINDDVLQKELSRTADEKMKQIVATIQKEQNVIIRNETSNELIIQGVAGSGKTSIALHRIAFLLYRYKERLSSRNVLIISPNKVFSDYISNVLPELGEEPIMEVNMEELASRELAGVCKFQTFYEQAAELIDSADERGIDRIKHKAAMDFVHELDSYIEHMDAEYFLPADIRIDTVSISKEAVLSSYHAAKRMPVKQRLEKTASVIIAGARAEDGQKVKASTAKKIKSAIKKMFRFEDMLALYKDFYHYIGKPDMFNWKQVKTLEYADVFPLIYLKIHFEGTASYHDVKHLVVDEMQDYTPIQYAVLSKLFKCKKTILGDNTQTVNPYSSSSFAEIKKVFPEADVVELLNSYRSTIEISNFSQKIKRNSKLIPIERHGDEPSIIKCGSINHELEEIVRFVRDFLKAEHQSLGIVCKTPIQAEYVYQSIRHASEAIYLIDFNSDEFRDGIIVTSAHMAKGLEFDQVIVPFADASAYQTELDQSLLYIACTRAMHKLNVTYSGKITRFLHHVVNSK
ncbi:HelD family protein [Paenibacillus apiarius]|uniref:HelD family protein n=1 Tax=Paenibacillus apiarius TaxID=46240 RepID=UPI003B39FC08